MKSLCFLGIALILLISSCQEEILTPSFNPDCDGYCPSSIGSYWIYEHYTVDSLGIDHPLNKRDTIIIVGDTLVGNNTYKMIEGEAPFFSSGNRAIIGLVRDSLDYLVSPKGEIQFSYRNFTDILLELILPSNGNGDISTHHFHMDNPIDSITVPIGTFRVLNYTRTSTSTDSLHTLIYSRNANQYYAKNIGKILQTYPSLNEQYERRLIQYHIQ